MKTNNCEIEKIINGIDKGTNSIKIAKAITNEFHLIPKNSSPEDWVEGIYHAGIHEQICKFKLKWRKDK